jgi:hypothetical protein
MLPGVGEAISEALAASGRLTVRRRVDLKSERVALGLRLDFRGGCPAFERASALVSFRGDKLPATAINEFRVAAAPAASVDLGTYTVQDDFEPAAVAVALLTARFQKRVNLRLSDVKQLAKARRHLESARSKRDIERTTLESLEWRIAHLVELIEAGDEDFAYLGREIKNTVKMAARLDSGEDPYHNRRGEVQRRGYRSRLDGKLHYYALYVPPAWREEGEGKFGLVVVLHGLNGTPMKTLQSVFGLPLDEGETKLHRERHPKPVPHVPYFVVAPGGFGKSGYAAYGERDIVDVMNEVQRRYRVDPNRIYITGASMGGIGAASLPLHYPDFFAAAAPLCGYHSVFQFRSVKGVPLSPWERFLVQHRSNVEWAANGRHLPLYIVHGLKDTPGHSRVLVDRFRKLRYDVTFETPDVGHNVWDDTYKGGGIFKRFANYRRPAHPRRVTFETARLRYRSTHWLEIDDVGDYARWARVDGIWNKGNDVHITTENLTALTIKNDEKLSGNERVEFFLDSEKPLVVEAKSPAWHFRKSNGQWEAGPGASCKGLCKRPGLAGPIRDARYEPLLFVYGSARNGEAALARRLIEEMRFPRYGTTIDWPVKADFEVTAEDINRHSLVIVGTVKGNAMLAKIAKSLPIRVEGEEILLGDKRFRGRAPAASFIYPNPLNAKRYVVVHTGVSLEALFYTAHLPGILPDYIIYDGPTWAWKRGRLLDDRKVLAAGFFDKKWQP